MTPEDAAAASEPPPPLAPAAPAAGAVPVRLLYLYSVPALLLLCAASVAVNARVLVAARWLRRPLSPTLRISLSLAAADAFASTMFAAGLLLNSLLKAAAHQQVNECLLLTVEALRLSGIIATVAHLLALATNHYLGILRPLHYPAIMTPRNTSASIVVLWLLPAAFFFGYFSLVPGQGFQSPGCCAEWRCSACRGVAALPAGPGRRRHRRGPRWRSPPPPTAASCTTASRCAAPRCHRGPSPPPCDGSRLLSPHISACERHRVRCKAATCFIPEDCSLALQQRSLVSQCTSGWIRLPRSPSNEDPHTKRPSESSRCTHSIENHCGFNGY
ncbi:uncharacterized protein LOC126267042 isoform X2 [Schistocerca gregaria]|uniref:uncharacterized protein LOC126267042 isoform X2 n=1 Tax=Schistocerca gregaria TaxID=7010 RepID=UPI00211DD9D1|nr:uncharacterized protein LOC126267042 isoform X2 [Schistocerca gregaria]